MILNDIRSRRMCMISFFASHPTRRRFIFAFPLSSFCRAWGSLREPTFMAAAPLPFVLAWLAEGPNQTSHAPRAASNPALLSSFDFPLFASTPSS
jgi:hypothetical protein